MSTASNENLIEQARKWNPSECAESPTNASRVINRLADALAVFEKAHTPTDNEREALRRDLYTLRGWSGGDAHRRIEIIDRAIAALSPPVVREVLDQVADRMDVTASEAEVGK